jgi:hypothetical protein
MYANKISLFRKVFVALAAISSSQQAPDCISIGRSNPEDISKFYHPHESDCNKVSRR